MEPTIIKSQTESSEASSSPPRDRVRIVSTPGTGGGRPRIDGHRITVEDVAIWHERMGMSPDEIVSSYLTITLSDVYAALAYYHENRQRIDTEIEEGRKFAEEMRAKAGPSRLQELLKAAAGRGEYRGEHRPCPSPNPSRRDWPRFQSNPSQQPNCGEL